MADQNIATAAPALKIKYPSGAPPKAIMAQSKFMSMVKKDENSVGEFTAVPIQLTSAQGSGSDIPSAQAAQQPTNYKRFQISTVAHFTLARIDGMALKKCNNNAGATVKIWTNEIDSAFMTETKNQEVYAFGNGTGVLGQVSASATVASTSLLLRVPSDAVKFSVGMTLKGVSDNTLSPTVRAGSALITKIDRVNGILQTGSNWSTQITSLAVDDYMVRASDQAVAGTPSVPTGLRGWIEGGTSPGTFMSLDRNTDSTGLAGTLLDVSGQPIDEALQNGIGTLTALGAPAAKTLWCHPLDFTALKIRLGSKVVYQRTEARSADGKIGFKTVSVEGDDGSEVQIMTSPLCDRYTAYLGDFDYFRWESAGKAPMILDFDKLEQLRQPTADAYELRIGAYSQGVADLPFAFVRFSNFGA